MAEEASNTIIRIAVTLAVTAVVILFIVWWLGGYTENQCKNAIISNLADLETKACSYHVTSGYADPHEDWLRLGDCVKKFYFENDKKTIEFTSNTKEESKAKCPTGEDVIYVGFDKDDDVNGPNVDYPVLVEPGVISLNVVKFQFNLLYNCPYSQCSGGGCDEAVEKLCNSIGLECSQCDIRQTYELTRNAEVEFIYGQVDYTGVDASVVAYTAESCGNTFGTQATISYCTGTAAPCNAISQQSCENKEQEGCDYSNLVGCKGTPKTCNEFPDETTCEKQSGCNWVEKSKDTSSGLPTGAVVGVGGPLYIAPELYNPGFTGDCGDRNENHCCNNGQPLPQNTETQITHCYFTDGTKLETFSTVIDNKAVVFWCEG